ncbi:MAG: hypothetical protein R2750_09750 [Bacteroidales bacterium]
MNLQRIEQLIGKYENGETSLTEEKELNVFFNRKDVPFEFRAYKDMFEFYKGAKEEILPDVAFDDKIMEIIAPKPLVNSKKTNVRFIYMVSGIAASVIIFIGIYFFSFNPANPGGTYNDPAIAYAATKEILMKVSTNMNTGSEQMLKIKELDKGLDDLQNLSEFDKGIKKMKKISVLDKSKDIIKQKNI